MFKFPQRNMSYNSRLSTPAINGHHNSISPFLDKLELELARENIVAPPHFSLRRGCENSIGGFTNDFVAWRRGLR